jgi:hypothetical protein
MQAQIQKPGSNPFFPDIPVDATVRVDVTFSWLWVPILLIIVGLTAMTMYMWCRTQGIVA